MGPPLERSRAIPNCRCTVDHMGSPTFHVVSKKYIDIDIILGRASCAAWLKPQSQTLSRQHCGGPSSCSVGPLVDPAPKMASSLCISMSAMSINSSRVCQPLRFRAPVTGSPSRGDSASLPDLSFKLENTTPCLLSDVLLRSTQPCTKSPVS